MICCDKCKRLKICERVEKGIAHSCVGFTPIVTKAAKIRAMDDRELARQIAYFTGYQGNSEEVEYWFNWLQQEVEE